MARHPSSPRSSKKGRMSSRVRPRPTHNTRLLRGSTTTVAYLWQRELVHHKDFNTAEIHRPQRVRKVCLIDRLDGVPTESEELGHVLYRQHLAKTRNALAQPARHARIAAQPFDMLEPRSAPRALHTSSVDQKPSRRAQQREVSHPPRRYIVGAAPLLLAAATPQTRCGRMQLNPDFRPRPLGARFEPPDRPDAVPVPATKQRITLVTGHGSHLLSRSRQAASR